MGHCTARRHEPVQVTQHSCSVEKQYNKLYFDPCITHSLTAVHALLPKVARYQHSNACLKWKAPEYDRKQPEQLAAILQDYRVPNRREH